MHSSQLSLYAGGEPWIDERFGSARRRSLGHGAWIDHAEGWVGGSDALFASLHASTRWRAERRVMYEREVAVPRLLATIPRDGEAHPLVRAMANALGRRYGERFDSIMLALYRDGTDSVAWHRDVVGKAREEAIVGVVTLGGSRRFMLRPHGGGASTSLTVCGGDLVVMGGTCQRTFEHCVPKTARPVDPRIAIMFRHA